MGQSDSEVCTIIVQIDNIKKWNALRHICITECNKKSVVIIYILVFRKHDSLDKHITSCNN